MNLPDKYRVIDLTQPIHEKMTTWPGDPQTRHENWAEISSHGFFLNALTIGEHTGTHCGAPGHFIQNGPDVSQIPATSLFHAFVKMDKGDVCSIDADFLLGKEHIVEWEKQFGEIEKTSILLVQTNRSALWNDPRLYLGLDGERMHFPGIGQEAAEYLIQKRGIAGIGIDTHGADGGRASTFPVGKMLARHRLMHIENLTNLALIDKSRGYLFIGALPIVGGSGSPCRVLALVE